MSGNDHAVGVIAVSSSGGHLAELRELVPRMVPPDVPVLWVTPDTAQTRSMLDGEPVEFIRRVRTRQALPALLNVAPAVSILRQARYRAVIGCGAASLTFLAVARAFGIPAHFIETATRTEGPSLTGRLLGGVPGVRRYTQHETWSDGHWLYRGSVFDDFAPVEGHAAPAIDRIVVTLGTNPYPFRRLLERMLAILPPSAEVLWQVGSTEAADLPIEAHGTVPARELQEALAAADVIVAHAGVGSVLASLEAGRIPVVVPRLKAFGEQVDNHQLLLVRELSDRGLAVTASVDDVDLDTLRRAAGLRATRRPATTAFELA